MTAQDLPAGSLTELQGRMRACRLCLQAGYEIYPRAIFSGNSKARIMLIGQAPGVTEKDSGRPFNAGSGTRLFRWLQEAGIEEDWFRSSQYMTAVTKCYPGRSASGSGDRVPSRAEQRLCRPYLDKEIEFVDPSLIIPVGRLAIGMYFDSKLPLDQIIGAQRQVNGRAVIPLPHPSGASRWHQIPSNQALISQAIDLIRGTISPLL
ncbi:MAG: uracil-DNA glycosylase family protein [Anaerolineales bacterium]